MQLIRLNTIALAAVSAQAAVLPRQEASSSPLTSLPNTSATSKSFLTSITSLPMPSSVEGNTAYPPSTTTTEVTSAVQSSVFSTPSSDSPFPWNAEPATTIASVSLDSATTSSGSATATGLADSTTVVPTDGLSSTLSSISSVISSISSSISNITAPASATSAPNNGTSVRAETTRAVSAGTAAHQGSSPSAGPYANSTTNGIVGGVAATGTAVVVTGVSAANATAISVTSSVNATVAKASASTSMLVQMYLNRPSTTLAKAKASATEVPLGDNMTLVVDEEDSTGSAAQATGTVALFANSTIASGVAQATGTGLSTAHLSTGPASASSTGNATISGAAAHTPSTANHSNTTFTSVTVKASATSNSTSPAATSSSAKTSSNAPLSTGSSSSSSPPVANAVDNNGTMFAVTYDAKNGTIIELVSASNATKSLATGTAAPSASASANLGRRGVLPAATPAPITPATSEKGSWSRFSYARTEYLPRPSRFFSGEGWSFRRRS